jgi:hypothetical protein
LRIAAVGDRRQRHAGAGKPHSTYFYQFFKDKYSAESKFYDLIPALLEKKYLKTIYNGVSHR